MRAVLFHTTLLLAALVLLFAMTARPGHAEGDVTALQVDSWAIAYSVERSSEEYPYVALIRDVRRVLACESGGSVDVINARRFGARGEVGPGQFMPGLGSIYYLSDAAKAGWPMSDPEANVAATVELISLGYGRQWSCW